MYLGNNLNGIGGRCVFSRNTNASLPVSRPWDPTIGLGFGSGLEVPNQLPPPRIDGMQSSFSYAGISPGMWGSRMMQNPFNENYGFWNDNEIYSLNSYGNMDRKDVEYNMIKNREDEKLRRNLSKFQRELLIQFGVVRGSHFVDC